MKTPREVLFERHCSAERKLDGLRAQVVSTIARAGRAPVAERAGAFVVLWPVRCIQKLWLELVWPARRIWAGFAFVWIALVALNLATADHSGAVQAKAGASTATMFLTWNEQQKILSELLAEPSPRVAEKPKPVKPQPRSECEPDWGIG